MGKKNKIKAQRNVAPQQETKTKKERLKPFLPWLFLVLGITAIALSPMLSNSFTNWDDDYYVTINKLLIGPDWKGIFTLPVNSNYHPITILSLALNYQLSGLEPYSYFLFNLLLHLTNTILVFYFAWNLSGKKIWVAVLTALIFGIHPLHVESIAWISERKDLLYSFFFLSSLLLYWRYLQSGKKIHYWVCFFLFIFSLLSKPAAIILPLVLILLDYWSDRKFNKVLFIEKIPFFIASLLLTVITLKVQSSAIIGLEVFPFWAKIFFACYVVMIYFFRFIYPQPLSAFHPYPPPEDLGLPILMSPLFIIVLIAIVWHYRKNKLIVFGILFFVINLLLVLQIISVGSTIVSERYTYMPYIGLAFLLSMLLNDHLSKFSGRLGWIALTAVSFVFGSITFQRTKVWKDSGTLWSDVIRQYKDAALPRSSRADYLYKTAIVASNSKQADSLFKLALEDCAVSLKGNPELYTTYRTQGMIFLRLNRNKEAITAADNVIKRSAMFPAELANAYSIRGTANLRLNQFQQAIEDFNESLKLNPTDDNAMMNRGIALYTLRQYDKALEDYNKAIVLNPKGEYFLNRSSCYYMMGQMLKAKEDARIAIEKGIVLPDNYKTSLQLK